MTNKLKIRKAFDREAVQIDFVDQESLTQQHFKDHCDINSIIARYDKTGLIEHVNRARAFYGDFTEVNEYQDAINLVQKGKESFMELPAEIRSRFNHDPGQFLEFVSNPKNIDEMVRLGLANPPKKADVQDDAKSSSKNPASPSTEGD